MKLNILPLSQRDERWKLKRLGTGTGTVSINGNTQIASGKTLKFNAGATVGTIGITFVDNDTSLMTSQAIKRKD